MYASAMPESAWVRPAPGTMFTQPIVPVARPLFVGDEHRADAARVFQRVVQLDVVGAGNPERVADALVFQGAYHDLATGQPHRVASSSTPSATRSASAMMVR